MKRTKKYENNSDEYLHPFWLGLLMLFTVTAMIGTICLLRKICGSRIRGLFTYFRRRNQSHKKTESKSDRHSITSSSYSWQPTYAPPPSLSPKLYKLVRNARRMSIDVQSPTLHFVNQEDFIQNDIFSITDESDFARPSIVQLNAMNRSETARKFFASMRYTSDHRMSLSMDSTNTEASFSQPPSTRSKATSNMKRIKLFRRPYFFQSITDTYK